MFLWEILMTCLIVELLCQVFILHGVSQGNGVTRRFLWIELPWMENPANTYTRHTETLESCFDLIRSHQQGIPWFPPQETKPATTDWRAETLQLSHQCDMDKMKIYAVPMFSSRNMRQLRLGYMIPTIRNDFWPDLFSNTERLCFYKA